MAYLVVRIRGTVNIPHWANLTLNSLKLDKRFRATLLPETDQTIGMLRKIKDVVTWTKADDNIIAELLSKRGRKSGFEQITDKDIPKEYENIEGLSKALANDQVILSKLENVKPWFALNPPKGGFKRKTKTQASQKGILGKNDDLIEIVKRMI